MSKKKKKYISKNNQEQETNLPALVISSEKNQIGRPSDYEKKVLPYLDKISYWVLLGYTNLDIAKKLDIAESTFYEYLRDFSEFSESVYRNKPLANEQVVESLFNRTKNQMVTEETIEIKESFKKNKYTGIEEPLVDDFGNPIVQHIKKITKRFIVGDVNAMKFWLINRDSENWKLKEASTEVNIDNSKNTTNTNNTQINLNHLSREELKEQLRQLYEIRSNNDSIIQDS